MTKDIYRLKIEAYSPETIPMQRLAEYLGDLATLLGNRENVHFVGLEDGSTTIVHAVDSEAVPKVRDRIRAVQTKDAPDEAMRAYRELDHRLEQDNAYALLLSPENKKVVEFPGRKRPKKLQYGPFNQDGIIDGQLIRIGGEEDIVPVHLREQEQRVHICQANHQTAKRLAPHLFGSPLRVKGNGRWFRDAEGNWEMKRFTIVDFEVLRSDSVKRAIERLRDIDSPIKQLEDPIAEIQKLRHGR